MGKRLAGRARRAFALATALVAAAALTAGCGGSGQTHTAAHPAGGGTRTAATTATRPAATPALAAGRTLFRANCSACHTLADANAHGRKAGSESDFDEIRPNLSSVRNFLEHRFGAMPLFRDRLSQRQIDVLAHYVATVDGCGTQSPIHCDQRFR
ncbi:MAG TPA: cytochrome c [Conexibacter sp.]|nr:cytochrome c [Conexibacter sp.]